MNEFVLFSWLMRRLMREQNEDRFNNLKIRITTFAQFANKSSEINGSKYAIDWLIDNGVIIDIGFEFFKMKKEAFIKYCTKNNIRVGDFNRKIMKPPKLSPRKIKAEELLLDSTLKNIEIKAHLDRLRRLENEQQIIIEKKVSKYKWKVELTKTGRVKPKRILKSDDNFENKTQ